MTIGLTSQIILIGWTKEHDQSRIVYLQLGDGLATYLQ